MSMPTSNSAEAYGVLHSSPRPTYGTNDVVRFHYGFRVLMLKCPMLLKHRLQSKV